MNLQNIIKEIKTITGYTPDQQNYDTKLVEMINQSYMEIWQSYGWNFATKEAQLATYPDIHVEAQCFDGLRYIAVSITDFPEIEQIVGVNNIIVGNRYLWIGQTVEIEGIGYTIQSIEFSPSGGGTGMFILDKPYRTDDDSQGASALLPATFIYSKIPLPDDMIEPLYIGIRDGVRSGKVEALSARMDEELNLWLDSDGGWPLAYINLPTLRMPPAGKTKVEAFNFTDHTEGQRFEANKHYEFAWAFKGDAGFTGPLSQPAKVVTPAGADPKRIVISFLDQFGNPVTSTFSTYTWGNESFVNDMPASTLSKQVFFNANMDPDTGVRTGPPVWVEVRNADQAGANPGTWDVNQIAISGLPLIGAHNDPSVNIYFRNQLNVNNPRYIDYDGIHNQVRLWPRVQDFKKFFRESTTSLVYNQPPEYYNRIQLRYRYKPPLLGLLSDAPQLPYPIYQALVWSVAAKVYLAQGDPRMYGVYEDKAQRSLKESAKRYVTRTDTNHKRADWFSFGDTVTGFRTVTYRG